MRHCYLPEMRHWYLSSIIVKSDIVICLPKICIFIIKQKMFKKQGEELFSKMMNESNSDGIFLS